MGIPKILLDNARALDKHVSHLSYGETLNSLERHQRKQIKLTWNENQKQWILNDGDSVYTFQPNLKFKTPEQPKPISSLVAYVSPTNPVKAKSNNLKPHLANDNDNDSFLNELERIYKTDPNNKNSHPPYYVRLNLVEFR